MAAVHDNQGNYDEAPRPPFTSPYPSGVAGLVKKRVESGCARTPFFPTTVATLFSSLISVHAVHAGSDAIVRAADTIETPRRLRLWRRHGLCLVLPLCHDFHEDLL